MLVALLGQYHCQFLSTYIVESKARFLIGTLLLETIVNGFGRFDLSKVQWSWIPKFFSKGQSTPVGFSLSQARLLSLLFSSTIHGFFFVMMGARGGFGGSFAAYSVAAFARAILTGEYLGLYAHFWTITNYLHICRRNPVIVFLSFY